MTSKKQIYRTTTACLIIIFLISCHSVAYIGQPINPQELTDGIYQGEFKHGLNKARVEATIRNQRIVKITILQHKAWKGKKVDTIIPERIIAGQSTRVDAVSGATNSSRVIMNAVQMAIEKSISLKARTEE